MATEYLVIDPSLERRVNFGEALIRGKEGVTYMSEAAVPSDLRHGKYAEVKFICHSGMVETLEAYLERRDGNKAVVEQLPHLPSPQSPKTAVTQKPTPIAKERQSREPSTLVARTPAEAPSYGFKVGSLSWHMERQRKEEMALYMKKLSAP